MFLAVKTFEMQLSDILRQRKAQMHQMEHGRKCSWKRKATLRAHRSAENKVSCNLFFNFIFDIGGEVWFGLVAESIRKLSFQIVKDSCVGKSAQTCCNVSLQSHYYKVCIHNYVTVMSEGRVLTRNVQIHMVGLWLLHICTCLSSHFKETTNLTEVKERKPSPLILTSNLTFLTHGA